MSPSDLSQPVLLSLLGGGFAAAFLHAALPTHWLPFVLVGRAQGWSVTRSLLAVTAAGLAHVASTVIVGSLIVAAGLALGSTIARLLPWLSAALLFGFGGFYLIRALARPPAMAGSGPRMDPPGSTVSHAAAFWGLVGVMALSPGEVLLPIYMSASGEGVTVLVLLTLVFAAGTVAGMTLFTMLARVGASILKLERWARYEGAILGVALIAIGLLIVRHQH